MSHQSPENGKPRETSAHLLREQSPTVVAHLAQGCSSCAAGLQAFHRTDAPDPVRRSVLDLFEKELFASFQSSGDAAVALHSALAGLATVQTERAAD